MYPFINHNQNDVISKMFWKNLHTLFYTLEEIVKDIYIGVSHEGYSVEYELPSQAKANIIDVTEDLIQEGKQVCFLLKDNQIISAIGYK